LKDPALAQRRLGRLQQRYWRAARAFEVKITPILNRSGKTRLRCEGRSKSVAPGGAA
jgi:hypothetical protein